LPDDAQVPIPDLSFLSATCSIFLERGGKRRKKWGDDDGRIAREEIDSIRFDSIGSNRRGVAREHEHNFILIELIVAACRMQARARLPCFASSFRFPLQFQYRQ
jgi:hypothetical protein